MMRFIILATSCAMVLTGCMGEPRQAFDYTKVPGRQVTTKR